MSTIALSMIVKDEATVIARCLDSVRPLIDYVSISDTGSTDGTQDIIRDWLRDAGVPGEVTDDPWRDFAHNRNVALRRLQARPDIDFILSADADDTLVLSEGFDVAAFKEKVGTNASTVPVDSYAIESRDGGLRFYRAQLMRRVVPFAYRGVLHEFVQDPPGLWCRETGAPFYFRYGHDGARRRNADTARRDVEVLAKAVRDEWEPHLRARYMGYLGRALEVAGERERALLAHLQRVALGPVLAPGSDWDEAIFLSLRAAGGLMADLGYPDEQVLDLWERAAAAAPWRAESLFDAARFCRLKGKFEDAYSYAVRGLARPRAITAFSDVSVAEWRLLDELAVSAYWTGRHAESREACARLLSEGHLPADQVRRVRDNLRLAEQGIAA